jgi:hypothetical protein
VSSFDTDQQEICHDTSPNQEGQAPRMTNMRQGQFSRLHNQRSVHQLNYQARNHNASAPQLNNQSRNFDLSTNQLNYQAHNYNFPNRNNNVSQVPQFTGRNPGLYRQMHPISYQQPDYNPAGGVYNGPQWTRQSNLRIQSISKVQKNDA